MKDIQLTNTSPGIDLNNRSKICKGGGACDVGGSLLG